MKSIMNNKLVKEFELVQKEINDKLRLSAKMLKEASELALTHNTSIEKRVYDGVKREHHFQFSAIEDLISSMEDCGWRTSSLTC